MRAELMAYRDIAALLLDALWRKIRYGESINERLTLEELQNRKILDMLEAMDKCRQH
jgi:hypothetical protein